MFILITQHFKLLHWKLQWHFRSLRATVYVKTGCQPHGNLVNIGAYMHCARAMSL